MGVRDAPGGTGLAAALVAENFGVDGATLVIDGVRADALVAAHGSPLYVYSAGVLERRWRALARCRPAG